MGKLQRLRRRILEVESVVAVDRSDGRRDKRRLIELRDERMPGGSLGGPGGAPFDQDIEYARLEEEERRDRIQNAQSELHTLRAEYSATLAMYLAIGSIVLAAIGMIVSVISLLISIK